MDSGKARSRRVGGVLPTLHSNVGFPAICVANMPKAHIAQQCGQDPSAPAAPGFARIHRATSPINGGGKNLLIENSENLFPRLTSLYHIAIIKISL